LTEIAHRRAHAVLHDEHEAEDIAQDVIVKAIERWAEISNYAEAWVARVAVNAAISSLRKTRRLVPLDSHDPGQALPFSDRVDVEAALDQLSDRQREVVVLRHLQDRSEGETAQILGISPGSVKRHLSRALDRLRTSPHLHAHGPQAGRPMTTPRYREGFVPASTDPDWPARPWDHRFVHAEDGAVDRIAVSQDGDVIYDLDGDEVMTGPGFNHSVVKVDRTSGMELKLQPNHYDFDPDAQDVLVLADRIAAAWGQPWLGTEHLDLALLSVVPDAPAALGCSLSHLQRALAEFYEGPFADDRLAIVVERLASGWRPRPLEHEEPRQPNPSLAAVLERAAAGRPGGIDQLLQATRSASYSLRENLLRPRRREPG
jgi:RNA polymerase sigma factor (sigma-70 family)